MKTSTRGWLASARTLGLGLLLLAVPAGKALAHNELITIPIILGDYYGWAYTEAFQDHADIYGWSTAGVDALGWTLVLTNHDYEGRAAGLFFVNVAGIAKTIYPVVTLLGASDQPTRERAWIAVGTHTVTLLTLELLGRPALSVESMGPRGDGMGLRLACQF